MGIFSIQLSPPLCRDANRTVTVVYRHTVDTWSFLFEVQVLSFVYCVLHQTQASICTEDQSHVLLHTSPGVLCFNRIQNELSKLKVYIFIQQKIKTNACKYIRNTCSTFLQNWLIPYSITYRIRYLFFLFNFGLRKNVDDFPSLAVVYHHLPNWFSNSLTTRAKWSKIKRGWISVKCIEAFIHVGKRKKSFSVIFHSSNVYIQYLTLLYCLSNLGLTTVLIFLSNIFFWLGTTILT